MEEIARLEQEIQDAVDWLKMHVVDEDVLREVNVFLWQTVSDERGE